jgi:hypothetical protein
MSKITAQCRKKCLQQNCIENDMVDKFCDKCDEQGYYYPVWSHPMSDASHCKNPFDGTEIPNTYKKVTRTKEFWQKRKTECKALQEKIIAQCEECAVILNPNDLIGTKWNERTCQQLRIVKKDGKWLIVTHDLRQNRLNVSVENGIIVETHGFY